MVWSSRVSMKMNSAINSAQVVLQLRYLIPCGGERQRSLRRGEMRAAVWDGPGNMTVAEVEDPTCPDDGVLLRVTACGICGTDVRAFYNGDRRISPPWVLGHEICGEVIEVGPRSD